MAYHSGKKRKKKKGKKRKSVPKGYHRMPNGKLMKGSSHGGKKRMKRGRKR